MTPSAGRKQEIDAQFGRAAEHYAKGEYRTGQDLQLIIELAQPKGTERVLDIGAGAGHTALALAPHVRSLVVTDLADGMLEKARSMFVQAGFRNAEFRMVDAQELSFGEAEFDIVTCRLAAHHFLDVDGATREVARVLKRDGLYLVVDTISPDDKEQASFLHEAETLRDRTHVRSYTRAEWLAICRRAGLRVEHVEVQRLRLAFDAWLERAAIGRATASVLQQSFLNAGSAIAGAFDIEVEDGRVKAFTDDKIILAARR